MSSSLEIRTIAPIETQPKSKPHSHSRKSSITTVRSPATPYDPVTSALSAAQARYTIANPLSLKQHNEACLDFPGGNTRTVLHANPFPMTFVKGDGAELTSADGDVYVDFLGEFTAGIYGHSNERIASAVSDALKDGWNYGGPNVYERKLARKITERFGPSGIELVRFTNSGTEANTMAIAAAVATTGRKKVVVFQNGYHGGTLSFPPMLAEPSTNLPHDFVLAPYNDIKGTQKIISALPEESVAAILVELVQGSGGCIVGNPEFLKYLNTIAHQLGAMFIVDEVMTSRLAYSGLSSSLGLEPDLVTLGKWIGGGMTFGAFGGRGDGPMLLFNPRDGLLKHSGTFNNNIVTMAAGCVGLEIYDREQVERLNNLGEKVKSGIDSILSNHRILGPKPPKGSALDPKDLENPALGNPSPPIILPDGFEFAALTITDEARMWVSGTGSMLCFHFSGESEQSLKSLLWHHLLDDGIYIAQRGFMALNLVLTDLHVQSLLAAVESFVVKYKQVLATSKA